MVDRDVLEVIEPFVSYLRDTLRETRIVEFMCGEGPQGRVLNLLY
jgi:hypothetical protein